MPSNPFVDRAVEIAHKSAFDECDRVDAGLVEFAPAHVAAAAFHARQDIAALLVLATDQALLLLQIKRLLWAVVILLGALVLGRYI